MPVSKAAQRATAKWQAKSYDQLRLLLPKGTKDRIKAVAPSVNGFIVDCVLAALEKEPVGKADKSD